MPGYSVRLMDWLAILLHNPDQRSFVVSGGDVAVDPFHRVVGSCLHEHHTTGTGQVATPARGTFSTIFSLMVAKIHSRSPLRSLRHFHT